MDFIKETDLEETSIGMIPQEWKVTTLKAVSEIRSNKGINGAGKIAFIPMELVSDSEPFVKYQLRKRDEIHSFTYCQAGDLLIAKITPSLENGKQGIVPLDVPNGVALATTEVFPIHTMGVDTLFLFYVLKHAKFRNKIIASMIGTTGRQRASKESLERLEIPLPTTEEQKGIAKVLSDVDSALELADGVIAKTERLKKGLMQHLLTHGIGHTEYQNTSIGKIPKEWKIVQISILGNVSTGKTPSTSNSTYWNGDLPFITPADMGNGKYVYKTERHVTAEGAKQSTILPKNAVLTVCIGSTIGKVALTQRESITNQQINSIVCNGEIVDPQYVYYALLFRSDFLRSFSGVAAVPIVKKSLFERFTIPLPPLQEQKRVAEIFSTVDCKLELEKTNKTKIERIKQGLMDLLLTGKIRIKVD